jgi:hypothetical protein
MKSRPLQKFMALCLGFLLVSCSTTQHLDLPPVGPHELSRHVLIIQETPDGKVTHDWRPLREFDPMEIQCALSKRPTRRGSVRVSSTGLDDYCRGRGRQCTEDCFKSRNPFPVGHLRYPKYEGPWRNGKRWWCPKSCGMLEDMCRRGMGGWAEEHAAEFDSTDTAVDWIKNHREEILVGTVIVIAGVAFVAATIASGGGALLFVPLLAMAEAPQEVPPTARIAEMTP